MTSTAGATVFIVDDDDAVRDSLTLLLRSVKLNAETYDSAQAFLETCDLDRSGCIVLDVRMPGMSGLELAEQLRQRQVELPILFITGHGDVPMAVQAMRLGAVDFIQKPFRDSDLLDRIFGAIEQDRDNRQRNDRRRAVRQRLATLTPRECQVLERLLDGKANKVIASELDVSQRTVEIHRARVMEKMQADSVAMLVRIVLDARQAPS